MPGHLAAVPDTPPRAILYLRQSVTREVGCRGLRRQGYVIVGVEADPGISGRTWQRTSVQRVMSMVEASDADIVVVWRWSRLSRNRKDWAIAIDRLDMAGGKLESASEPNGNRASDRFARGVLSELSAFESERIGEQWRDVQESRIARGLPSGKIPFGWISDKKTIHPHPEHAGLINEMYRRTLAGDSAASVARWINSQGIRGSHGGAWSNVTVRQVLNSPIHAGLISYKGQLHEGAHDGIIDRETWEQWLALRERQKTERSRERERHYLLSGICICECGARMYGLNKTSNGRASRVLYQCAHQSALTKPADHGRSTSITSTIPETAVMKWLHQVADGLAAELQRERANQAADAEIDTARVARDITSIDTKVARLTEQLADGIVPERAYTVTVTALTERRAELTAALSRAERQRLLSIDNPQAFARDILADWDLLPVTARRTALARLIESVQINFKTRSATVIPR